MWGFKMKEQITSGIRRNKQFMQNAEDVVELEISYEAAKAYLAGCNDSGALDFNQWQLKRFEIDILYRNLKESLERA